MENLYCCVVEYNDKNFDNVEFRGIIHSVENNKLPNDISTNDIYAGCKYKYTKNIKDHCLDDQN